MLFCLGMISFPADDSRSRRHNFLLNRTASYELDPISELPRALGFALCLEPRVFALELANIAERPEALQAPLTRSIAGLSSLEHPADRNLTTVSFESFDLLKSHDLEARGLGCANPSSQLKSHDLEARSLGGANLSSKLIAKLLGSC